MRPRAKENAERQSAAYNLGQSLYGEGQFGEAGRMFREVHGIWMRLRGAEHPQTLRVGPGCANEIALCRFNGPTKVVTEQRQGRADQPRSAVQRVLGPEHPGALMSAGNLATSIDLSPSPTEEC